MDPCPLTNKPCDKHRTIHVTDVENGRAVASVDLCEQCGEEFLRANTPIITFFQNVLKQKAVNFVETLFGVTLQPAKPPPSVKQCPKCGWTLDDISRQRKLGCAECYNFFDTYDLLRNIHGSDVHVGKRPKHKPATRQQDSTITTVEVAKNIVEAKKIMDEAVESEDYATAARMRDMIRALSPILDLMEECESQIRLLSISPGSPDQAGLIGQQILDLQREYEQVLRTYA